LGGFVVGVGGGGGGGWGGFGSGQGVFLEVRQTEGRKNCVISSREGRGIQLRCTERGGGGAGESTFQSIPVLATGEIGKADPCDQINKRDGSSWTFEAWESGWLSHKVPRVEAF